MSILSLNNLGIFNEICDLIKTGSTEEDLDKLKGLWTFAGLDVDGCEWFLSDYGSIKYEYTPTNCVMLEARWFRGKSEEIELTDPSGWSSPKEREIEISQRLLVLLSSTKKFIIDKSFIRSRHYLLKLK